MNKFERLFNVMTKPLVIALYCLIIIFLFVNVDQSITTYIHTLQMKLPLSSLRALTCLGNGPVYILALPIIALACRFLFHCKQLEKRTWFLWLCVVVPYFICFILKVSFGRARPELLFSEHLYGFYGLHKSEIYWSFPSGHTTTIMGLAFGLCALFPRYCVAFILFGVIVAVSRILLLQHYLTDVLMAGYLALIEVGLLYHWSKLMGIEIEPRSLGNGQLDK